MTRRILTAVIAATLLTPSARIRAQDTSEAMRQDVIRLMELTGASNMGEQMASAVASQFIEAMRRSQPDLPDRALKITAEVIEEFKSRGAFNSEAMLNDLVPVYARHLTHEDVKSLLEFYESPTGRKIMENLPLILKESMDVGQALGERITPEIQAALIARFQEEGILPKQDTTE